MASIVSVAACKNYNDFFKVKKAVEKSLEPLGGIKAFVRPGQKVLLKPNVLGAFPPEAAVTTHPAIVKAVLQIVKSAKAKPFVAESCGIGIGASTTKAFEKSGLMAVAEEEKVECVPLETMGYRKIGGKKCFLFSKAFLDADVVISLPKLKTHLLTLYTGAIKNSFGAIPAVERKRFHKSKNEEEFCSGLINVFLSRKPELVIMDAVVAMEGMGPVAGKPKSFGAVISSNDAVALDTVVCNAIGFEEINTIKKAREKNAGETLLKEIIVSGKVHQIRLAKPFVVQSRIPMFIVSLYQSVTSVKPVVDYSKCKKCGVCAGHCPVKAIELMPFPVIDEKKCVCCFCCSELCPEQAITIEPGFFGKTLMIAKALVFGVLEKIKHKKTR